MISNQLKYRKLRSYEDWIAGIANCFDSPLIFTAIFVIFMSFTERGRSMLVRKPMCRKPKTIKKLPEDEYWENYEEMNYVFQSRE